MFKKQPNRRATSASDTDVIVPNNRMAIGRKSFAYKGPVFWNSLKTELKNIETVNGFKNAYVKELLREVNHPG